MQRLAARVTKLLVIGYWLLVIAPKPASATEEFTINFNTTYNVQTDGTAKVRQNINLKNNLSQVYATSYSLMLEGKKPTDVKVLQDGQSLPFKTTQEGDQWQVTVEFPDALVGKNKERPFSVAYTLAGVATQNGQVWDVTVPKLASADDIAGYNLQLSVPETFGQPVYISPEPKNKVKAGNLQIFTFQKEDLARAGVVAAFGEFQVFSFNLSYHLENPLGRLGQTEIALPPDTAYQRVFYTTLSPKPRKVTLDREGNWLATYRLAPNERLDVTAAGSVQIFATPQQFYPTQNGNEPRYLKAGEFWPKDGQIKELAERLGTARAIYDYVVNTLSYDYGRVREGVERLGGKKALENPETAICMEFTDLFVTLARSGGIPAREINGYAYTDNPEVQPLSLVADVLHAWPEYWDEDKGVWRPVDPTWGNTTGGVDFFNKFDLSHFVFAIHADDVNDPPPAGSYKLGPNPQKDVNVSFGALPVERTGKIEFRGILPKTLVPFIPTTLSLIIENTGPVAIYDTEISAQAQGAMLVSAPEDIDFLAPFADEVKELSFNLPLFPREEAAVILRAGESSYVYNIPVRRILILQILSVFLGLISVLGSAFVLIHSGAFSRLLRRI